MKVRTTIQLHDLKGGSNRDKKRYLKAIKIAEEIINSEQFKQRINNFQYIFNGMLINQFKNNKGLSNNQIYILIRSGYDTFNKEKDNDLDLSVTLYKNRWASTVGYTYPDTFKTWVNTKFFVGNEDRIIAGIVGNLIHEYMHNAGFDHAFKNNPTRQFSVPYAIGSIAYELALEYLQLDQSETVWTCTKYWFFWTRCRWENVLDS